MLERAVKDDNSNLVKYVLFPYFSLENLNDSS